MMITWGLMSMLLLVLPRVVLTGVSDNSKGEKVSIKAHGGPIDIEGVGVAVVNDKLQLTKVEVFFDPMTMFRQMAAKGNVTKEPVAAE
jgi:hypothetical protein